MINSFNYTNFLYRPRRPEELDTAQGGGILFNQVPHQIDIARLLGGGLVRSVRAQTTVLDPARPTEGSCYRVSAIRKWRRRVAGLQRLRLFRFRRMALLDQRARRSEGTRPTVPRAARSREAQGRNATAHREVRLRRAEPATAAAPAAFRVDDRHLRERRSAASADGLIEIRRSPEQARSRSSVAPGCPAAAKCSTTWRRVTPRPPADARRPLGQGHRGGCARDPAIGEGAARDHAASSGAGAAGIIWRLDMDDRQYGRDD